MLDSGLVLDVVIVSSKNQGPPGFETRVGVALNSPKSCCSGLWSDRDGDVSTIQVLIETVDTKDDCLSFFV